MTNYIINFGIYTMAMIGFLAICVLIYKKSNTINLNNKSALKIDDKIALNARKSLYVVNAGGERFLIAGDIDNTSLIARLGDSNVSEINENMTSLLKTTKETKKEPNKNVDADFDAVIFSTKEEKKYISHEAEYSTLPIFKPESTQNVEKSIDDAFNRIDLARSGKYLDIKSIRKKPVMKELARKLAQI